MIIKGGVHKISLKYTLHKHNSCNHKQNTEIWDILMPFILRRNSTVTNIPFTLFNFILGLLVVILIIIYMGREWIQTGIPAGASTVNSAGHLVMMAATNAWSTRLPFRFATTPYHIHEVLWAWGLSGSYCGWYTIFYLPSIFGDVEIRGAQFVSWFGKYSLEMGTQDMQEKIQLSWWKWHEFQRPTTLSCVQSVPCLTHGCSCRLTI